jgi:hypothetical protein
MRADDAAASVEMGGGEWDDAHAAIERSGRRDDTLAIGFGAAGAAAIVTGAVLVWRGRF